MIRDQVSLGLGDSGLNVLHLSLQVCQLLIQQSQPAACNIRVYNNHNYVHTPLQSASIDYPKVSSLIEKYVARD